MGLVVIILITIIIIIMPDIFVSGISWTWQSVHEAEVLKYGKHIVDHRAETG